MKTLKELNFETLNQSKFDTLSAKEMALFGGINSSDATASTYGSCNTATAHNSTGKVTDDGADEVD